MFNDDWNDFCDNPGHRGIPLGIPMKRNYYNAVFNVHYTYWARKHMAQACPDLMKYFGQWFLSHVSPAKDPYNLKRYSNKLYGLAFEGVTLGAASIEREC